MDMLITFMHNQWHPYGDVNNKTMDINEQCQYIKQILKLIYNNK